MLAITGRLTKDPELRETNNSKLASFRLAFNTSEKVDGQWGDKGNFINVTLWGNMAEGFCRYAKKGSQVAVKGRIQQRAWTDKEGNTREVIEIVAERANLIGPRDDTAPSRSNAPKKVAAPVDDHDDIPF